MILNSAENAAESANEKQPSIVQCNLMTRCAYIHHVQLTSAPMCMANFGTAEVTAYGVPKLPAHVIKILTNHITMRCFRIFAKNQRWQPEWQELMATDASKQAS